MPTAVAELEPDTATTGDETPHPSRLDRWRSPEVRAVTRKAAIALAMVAGVLVLWELVELAFHPKELYLPAPGAVWQYFMHNQAGLWADTQRTAVEAITAFLLSMAVGIPLAILTCQFKWFENTVWPLLLGTQAFPKLAVGPLFIVWFGIGQAPIILLALLVTFFPVALNTVAGLRSVRKETVELAQLMGFSRWRRLIRMEIPQALPGIFAGLRLSSTLAVTAAMVGEFLGSSSGLGYRIVTATGYADTVGLFATMIALALMGVILYGLIAAVEFIALPWYRPTLHDAPGRGGAA